MLVEMYSLTCECTLQQGGAGSRFGLPVAIIAKCEEKILLAKKFHLAKASGKKKKKSKEKITIQILPTPAVYCQDFTLLRTYKSPIKTFMYLSKS